MAVVLDKHAEVAIASEFTCAMTHHEHGRCAESAKAEDHHVIKRSEQGTDEASNRVLVCTRHHQQIHGDRRPDVFRVHVGSNGSGSSVYRSDSPGSYLYAEDLGAQGATYLDTICAAHGGDGLDTLERELAARSFDVWHLWPNVREEWEQRAAVLDARMDVLVSTGYSLAWDMAQVAYEIQHRGQLWSLFGFDDLRQYSESKGLRAATLVSYARAERILREVVNDPAERDAARRIPLTVWQQKGADLATLGIGKVQELIFAADQQLPATAMMAMVEEDAPPGSRTGKPRYRVEMEASVRFAFEINADSADAAREKALRMLMAYKSLDRYTIGETTCEQVDQS